MSEAEKLDIYLDRLKTLSKEILEQKESATAIQALQEALHYIEGEMIGY